MLYLFRDILKNWKLLSILLFAAACQSESENTLQPTNKFHDDVLVKIYDYQDKRQTDSLLQYFDHENAAYRRAAAEAFGSVQDSLAIPYLTLLLNDQNAKVRKAAAY
ncbi:MAG: HEAT repeat domain-containing protein, partial [Fulvivirga sp.]|nr:HEAT repeat domain-containing protein [Fulvivirga sp.]